MQVEKGPGHGGDAARFHFPRQPGRVRHNVTIVAPLQHVRGMPHPVEIRALPLTDLPATLTKGENRTTILGGVIHPEVRSTVDGAILTSFEPPLQITVEYTDEDIAATERIAGKGHVPSLISLWYDEAGGMWRWERLKTVSDLEARTLSAELANLNPLDPVAQGFP